MEKNGMARDKKSPSSPKTRWASVVVILVARCLHRHQLGNVGVRHHESFLSEFQFCECL